jgi:urea transport system substrate-binding protein
MLAFSRATWMLLASAALASCDTQPPKDDGKLVVGVIADRTGLMSGHGQSIEMGAKLAADQINAAGGVNGKPIELVVLDGQSDPAATGERARELIQRHGADLLLGTGTSAATLAAIGPATEAKVPFIYALDGEIKTCAPRQLNVLNPYVFASGFSERMAVEPLLSFVAEHAGKPAGQAKIFLVGGDYVYPHTTNAYARQVAAKLGMTVVGDEYSDTATADYTPLIRKILAAKPDVLIVTNPGASGVTFMRQARQFGLPSKMLISGFATFDQEAVNAMGNASEGVFVINRYSNQLQSPANAQFVAAFRKAYPDQRLLPGPTAAAGAFGALMIVADAARDAKTTSADGLIAAMQGRQASLPQGTVRISANNHMFEQPLYIMQIRSQAYQVVKTVPMAGHPGFEACSVR